MSSHSRHGRGQLRKVHIKSTESKSVQVKSQVKVNRNSSKSNVNLLETGSSRVTSLHDESPVKSQI